MILQRSTFIRGRVAASILFGVNGFITGAWAPQIPLLLPRHDISERMLGLLILALGLGAIAAMMFTGPQITRRGSAAVLRPLSFCVLIGLPLVVFAPSLGAVTLAMVVLGAVLGSMDVAMNANTVELESASGRAIMSSCHGCWSLGGFLGAGIGGWIIAQFDARTAALSVAAIGLLVVLAVLPLVQGNPPKPAASQQAKAEKGPLLPRNPKLWLLGFLALCCMIPEGAVLDWAALYLKQDLGAGDFRASLAFAAFSGTMAIVRFAGDGLRNRFGAVNTLRLSGLVAAAGMVLAAIAPNDGLAILAFAMAGLGVANMVPIMFSAAGHFPGIPAASALSVVSMVGYSGILVAPASIGFLAQAIGFRLTYGGLALLLLLVVALAGMAKGADNLRSH